MGTTYEKIYDNVLPKLRSWDIPMMSEDEVKDTLHDYLVPAITRFHVCRKDLRKRDEEHQTFRVKLNSVEIEILANYLLIEYLDSEYIRTPTLLKASLSSTDFNSYSSANMLDKLMAMHKTYLAENETLLSRYAWLTYPRTRMSLSVGYDKQDDLPDSVGVYDPYFEEDDEVPRIEVVGTVEGKPFSEPEVKDVWSGDDVLLQFTIPAQPKINIVQVNTVESDEEAGVVAIPNEEAGTIDVTVNVPRGEDGEIVHDPVTNDQIDSLF